MNYLSVCSGIEAATVAWNDLNWNPVGFSEIEKFPSEVLAHHYPNIKNFGDMTKYKEWNLEKSINLLVGGTPCQSFSVAGLRKGLEDPRGNLALTYCGILDHFRPKWFIWENVPGVLSSSGGRDFGSFLGALAQLGYGFAYRVLDAQHFGVAQRRRRVFVVGHIGSWEPAAKVLFERESLLWDSKKGKRKGEEIAERPRTSVGTLCARDYKGAGNEYVEQGKCIVETQPFTPSSFGNYSEGVGTLKRSGGDLGGGSETLLCENNMGVISFDNNRRDGIRFAHAFKMRGGCDGGGKGYLGKDEAAFTISTRQDQQVAIGFTQADAARDIGKNVSPTIRSGGDGGYPNHSVQINMAVRRLTPIECERLQGFPDNYTNIKENCPDTPRYKALGNSMAVPVMKWIGKRIQMIDQFYE